MPLFPFGKDVLMTSTYFCFGKEGDIGVCGVAVLLSFWCGIPVNKIPHCGVAVISNPTVRDVCAFKPTVFSETKLFAPNGIALTKNNPHEKIKYR